MAPTVALLAFVASAHALVVTPRVAVHAVSPRAVHAVTPLAVHAVTPLAVHAARMPLVAMTSATEAREKIFEDLKAPMKAITAWLASKKGVPEPEGPTADEIEEYCNGVDADECSIDLVEQLREEASIMRKADPSGMQRWNEEYCSSDEACEAGMPDL